MPTLTVNNNRLHLLSEMTIRRLTAEDAHLMSALLLLQSPEYMQYCHLSFTYDPEGVAAELAKGKEDMYLGIFIKEQLASFFMLRGWDDGFPGAALGVVVSEEFKGCGLLQFSIDMAETICRTAGCPYLMYRSHPDNAPARIAEKMGFTQTGVDQNGWLEFHVYF